MQNINFGEELPERLDKEHITVVSEYQRGFQQGRLTIDQMFTLRMVQNNSNQQNLELCILFTDFERTYDSY